MFGAALRLFWQAGGYLRPLARVGQLRAAVKPPSTAVTATPNAGSVRASVGPPVSAKASG
ncbi:hypothetical protein [Limnoglobus roseus]|uniref:Uncharacterized protein n=1 Tax=Limnoglobus roseus TaxID=2598579 RepID=A0A5C1AKS1_9BACT|nr:hypothetical protein [Limnoglobus roseus]QEL18312.1 hypothetical protein PX52LOC_05333 [Limnoglobus roseus]